MKTGMRIGSFALGMGALLVAQTLAVVGGRVTEFSGRFQSTPMLTPAESLDPRLFVAGASVFILLMFARLRREPGPLALGSFLTGFGHVGLQSVALEWSKTWAIPGGQDSAGCTGCLIAVFTVMAAAGAWRAARARNLDDSMAMISFFISAVAAVAISYFAIGSFPKMALPPAWLAGMGTVLSAWPAYFSAKACVTQMTLIRPGGGRALGMILALNGLGALGGGVIVHGVIATLGVTYATALVGCLYLLAAWLFTQSRSEPFAGAFA